MKIIPKTMVCLVALFLGTLSFAGYDHGPRPIPTELVKSRNYEVLTDYCESNKRYPTSSYTDKIFGALISLAVKENNQEMVRFLVKQCFLDVNEKWDNVSPLELALDLKNLRDGRASFELRCQTF